MKAIVQHRYGGADTLEVADIDRPDAGPGHVLVRVRAAGVDPGVRHVMTGRPYLMRVIGFGLRAPNVRVRGRDLAGVVESVGPDVTGFAPGDEVFGVTLEGSFAEYARVRPDRIAPKPASLTFEQAAAVPVSACAALRALRAAGEVGPGRRVLVIGAAGGIGTFAVQLAKAFGARVTGVCSTTKLDLVRSIGADEVIDYQRQNLTDGGRHDVILDTAGGRRLATLRQALTRHGTVVLVGSEDGGHVVGPIGRPLAATLLSPFVRHNLRSLLSTERSEDLRFLTPLIDSGRLTPVIHRSYPLEAAGEAMRALDTAHARGKTVITV